MPDEMQRARAARALLVDARAHEAHDQAEEEMAAFMAIFHPERQLRPGERWTDPPKERSWPRR